MCRTLGVVWISVVALMLLAWVGCGGPSVDSDARSDEPAVTAGAETDPDGPPPWILSSQKQPRGRMRHEPEASDHYVLFTQLTSGTEYLIDRGGRVVHTWENDKSGGASYLQEDGTLLRSARIPEPPNFRAGGISGYLQKLDWDGNVLWQWQMVDDERALHHDFEPLPNGNILALAWEQKSKEEAVTAGRLERLIPEQGLWSEWIVETEPIGTDDARIVWEWHVWDHLIQNHDADAASYGEPAEHPRRLDINAGGESFVDEEELEQLKALGYVPDNATADDVQSDFLHINAIDYHPGLDQIAVSLPQTGEIWILDHATTTEEARGSTVFNNGGERGWTSVIELAPPVTADGAYPLADDEAWGPDEPVWIYEAEARESFLAPFISGAVRLETGNTLICSGPQGRDFEVTPEGKIVWEYLNSYHGDVPGWSPPGTDALYYASFRAIPIVRDHPALAGRDLTPLDPQPEAYVPPPTAHD